MRATIRTSRGTDTPMQPELLEGLQRSLKGDVLTEDSEGYGEARSIWNGMIDRKPALIARCRSAEDVAHAVRFASENDLLLSVRGGGHNIAGSALCDGGLTIDLSAMNAVQVDPERRTAIVGPGATLGDFDAAAQKHGLATPLGVNSTTGVAGLTLGGGFGWLSRKHGLTIDNLLSAEIVTADGNRVRASESENPDLFWAIRGGGGNFGVVTSFEFKLHPVGPQVLSGLVIHPLAAARDLLRFYRDTVLDTPEEFVCWFVMRKAPPAPFVPEDWIGKEIIALAMFYNGPMEEGEKIAAPLRSFGESVVDVVGPHEYTAWQQALDPLLTPGERNYWKTRYFERIDDGLIDVLVDFAGRLPDPQSEIAFAQLGGAIARVPLDATAYVDREPDFLINLHTRWSDPAKDAECVAWARALFDATAPFGTAGGYVNFLTQEEADRIPSVYGSNYERLVELKDRYDPGNLFRTNMNIRS